jgi:hypothetical protein
MLRKPVVAILAVAMVPLAATLWLGTEAGATKAPPVNATNATVQCTGLKGTAKFSPPLTSSTDNIDRTTSVKGTLSGCTTSDDVTVSSAKISGSFQHSTDKGCTATAGMNDITGSIKITWKTSPAITTKTSTITVHTVYGTAASDGDALLTIPGSGGTPSSGTGSFQGTDGGAGDTNVFETTETATTIISTCETSKKGVSSVGLQGPQSGGTALSLG